MTVSTDELAATVKALAAQLDRLTAEADIRKVQARYMYLCDTPCPEAGVDDDAERIERIVSLYTEDAVWEGVGSYYDNQFGRSVGRDAIRKHFQGFWGQKRDPALVLNVHYLTTEDIAVTGDEAEEQRTLEGLIAARGYVRAQLLERMGVRHLPELAFHIDRTEKINARMDTLLTRMEKRDRRKQAAAAGRGAASS